MKKKLGKSKYSEKKARGNQMYGPGCCAHTITSAQITAAKDAARKAGITRNWE